MQFSEGKDEDLNKDSSSAYNPWPFFKFTGKNSTFMSAKNINSNICKTGNLRPYPQSSTRNVPVHIPRPDYADHYKGHPVSEQKQKSSTQIKVLNEEEIEEMRIACKVNSNFYLKINHLRWSKFNLCGIIYHLLTLPNKICSWAERY